MNDSIFQDFLTTSSVVLLIGCWALTWFTRRGIETKWTSLRPVKRADGSDSYLNRVSYWWNSFILYLIPPAWGIALGALLFKHLAWPPNFKTLQAVMFFGMVCGWLSGLLYKLLIRVLMKRLGEEDPKKAEDAAKDPVIAGAKEDTKVDVSVDVKVE